MHANTRTSPNRTRHARLAAGMLASCAGIAAAQTSWSLNAAAGRINSETFANEGCDGITAGAIIGRPGFTNLPTGEWVMRVSNWEKDEAFCPQRSRVISDSVEQVRLSGFGTRRVFMRWDLICRSKAEANEFSGWGIGDMNAQVDLLIDGPVHGAPVFVDWTWNQFGFLNTASEAGNCGTPEVPFLDSANVRGDMFLNGVEQLLGQFDVVLPPGAGLVFLNRQNQSGQFAAQVGDTITFEVDTNGDARIALPGYGPGCTRDLGSVAFQGNMTLTIRLPGEPVLPSSCPDQQVLFSLDIGSDTELSAWIFDGDEVFDPGDVYAASQTALGSPQDGWLDDEFLFAADPSPDDDSGTSAPTCSGLNLPDVVRDHFDLDGTDALDILPNIPRTRLDRPIPKFDSTLIFDVEHLAISYDDDGDRNYVACDVPTSIDWPAFGRDYGDAVNRDEVMAMSLAPINPMVVAGGPYGIASERQIHISLAPDPTTRLEDDDVDALDVIPVNTDRASIYWTFSADHEAVSPLSLNPGHIYYVGPAGGPPRVLVNAMVHLGLQAGVDIDAFEFGFLDNDMDMLGGPHLALLFSVDRDDPATPEDESGGLDPTIIYYSYMTGTSHELVDGLDDNVDALAIYCSDVRTPNVPRRCPADLSGSPDPTNPAYGVPDGVVDAADFFYFLDQFVAGNVAVADLTGSVVPGDPQYGVPDGTIDASDFFYYLDLFVAGCP